MTFLTSLVTVSVIDCLVDSLEILRIFLLSFIVLIVLLNLLSAVLVYEPWFKIVSVHLEEAFLQAAHFLNIFFKLVVRLVIRSFVNIRMNQVRMVTNIILAKIFIVHWFVDGFRLATSIDSPVGKKTNKGTKENSGNNNDSDYSGDNYITVRSISIRDSQHKTKSNSSTNDTSEAHKEKFLPLDSRFVSAKLKQFNESQNTAEASKNNNKEFNSNQAWRPLVALVREESQTQV